MSAVVVHWGVRLRYDEYVSPHGTRVVESAGALCGGWNSARWRTTSRPEHLTCRRCKKMLARIDALAPTPACQNEPSRTPEPKEPRR